MTQDSCRLPLPQRMLRVGFGSALGTSLRSPFLRLLYEPLVRTRVVERLDADTRVHAQVSSSSEEVVSASVVPSPPVTRVLARFRWSETQMSVPQAT